MPSKYRIEESPTLDPLRQYFIYDMKESPEDFMAITTTEKDAKRIVKALELLDRTTSYPGVKKNDGPKTKRS